jgi:hypothetical protein
VSPVREYQVGNGNNERLIDRLELAGGNLRLKPLQWIWRESDIHA